MVAGTGPYICSTVAPFKASLTVGRKAVSRLTLALTGVWLAGCVRFAHVCRMSSSWVSRFGRRMLTLAVLARSPGGLAASSSGSRHGWWSAYALFSIHG
ncbi:putative lipoprotein [Burkholderia pseudomallei]|nr:putative lipoprotein [Burkholderia pseudomallei]